MSDENNKQDELNKEEQEQENPAGDQEQEQKNAAKKKKPKGPHYSVNDFLPKNRKQKKKK